MATAPVRGTQSFVGVMAEVWGRYSLSGLEIAWRWLPGAVIAGFILYGGAVLGRLGISLHVTSQVSADVTAVQSISAFQPVVAVHVLSTTYSDLLAAMAPSVYWLVALFLLWNIVAALGRTAVLRRFDAMLHARRLALFLLGTLRSALLLGAWWLWSRLIAFGAHTAIQKRAERGEDPSVVFFAAIVIVGTLSMYVAWAVFSWFLQLAPLLAMRRNLGAGAALRAALGSSRELCAKLIEINLVLDIVRIGLLVLTTVFCATPLPFTSVATAQYLHFWWMGVGLVYLAFSDYFHVVREASYLSLHRVLGNPA